MCLFMYWHTALVAVVDKAVLAQGKTVLIMCKAAVAVAVQVLLLTELFMEMAVRR
jgi:hypothetical protein